MVIYLLNNIFDIFNQLIGRLTKFRDGKTGLNAPLYGNENDTQETMEFNQDWSVSYW